MVMVAFEECADLFWVMMMMMMMMMMVMMMMMMSMMMMIMIMMMMMMIDAWIVGKVEAPAKAKRIELNAEK